MVMLMTGKDWGSERERDTEGETVNKERRGGGGEWMGATQDGKTRGSRN